MRLQMDSVVVADNLATILYSDFLIPSETVLAHLRCIMSVYRITFGLFPDV